jgi:hypothetical protein
MAFKAKDDEYDYLFKGKYNLNRKCMYVLRFL